jgi:hypothetical protein
MPLKTLGLIGPRAVGERVKLCLVTIKYKNTSWRNITVPQKYVFDFKE